MIAIDRYKKSLSCIMAVFTMMSLRMNLLKMDYKGKSVRSEEHTSELQSLL